jgi:LPXTG-motif cell wall-anchored protein
MLPDTGVSAKDYSIFGLGIIILMLGFAVLDYERRRSAQTRLEE